MGVFSGWEAFYPLWLLFSWKRSLWFCEERQIVTVHQTRRIMENATCTRDSYNSLMARGTCELLGFQTWEIITLTSHCYCCDPSSFHSHTQFFSLTLLAKAYYNYLIRSVTSCSKERKDETLFSKLKLCFQECFHLGGGLRYSQLKWNPKIISSQNFGSQHLSALESSCKINSHFHTSASSGFSWTRKVRDCFCAFSSLTVLTKSSLCLWEVHPNQTCQSDSYRSSACLLTLVQCVLTFLPYRISTLQCAMSVVRRIRNSSLMDPFYSFAKSGWAIKSYWLVLWGLWCPP